MNAKTEHPGAERHRAALGIWRYAKAHLEPPHLTQAAELVALWVDSGSTYPVQRDDTTIAANPHAVWIAWQLTTELIAVRPYVRPIDYNSYLDEFARYCKRKIEHSPQLPPLIPQPQENRP